MLVKSVSFLSASTKSINPVQKYPHITELFACTRNVSFDVFILDTFFNFFRNMFNAEAIKINNFILFTKQSNPMCTYVCIFVKVYYISPILYFIRQIVSRTNTIKSWFHSILLLYFNIC